MTRIPEKPNRSSSPVQRGIEAGGPEKLGQVSRLPKSPPREDSQTTRQPSRSSSGKRRRRRHHRSLPKKDDGIILRRWLLLALGLGGGAFLFLLFWSLAQQRQTTDPLQLRAEGRDAAALENHDPLDSEEALALAGKLTKAESADDLAPHLRAGSLDSDQAFAFLEDLRQRHGEILHTSWSGSLGSDMVPAESVITTQARGARRLIALTPAADGTWQIDFDAFAAHCEPPFAAYPEKPVADGLVRALVVRYNYYNRHFRDDSVWACFALRNPNSDALIYGYCRRDSDTMRQIAAVETARMRDAEALSLASPDRARRNPQEPIRLTLELAKLEGAEPRQYHIERVISDDWVIPRDAETPAP